MFRLTRKAQSTAEYAIVIAIVIGAVVAMQVYVRRGLQGRMRDATDYLAVQTPELGSGPEYEQYEPQELERNLKQTRHDPVKEEFKAEGEVVRTIEPEGQTTTAEGYEKYNAPE